MIALNLLAICLSVVALVMLNGLWVLLVIVPALLAVLVLVLVH